ncbi:MAG: hypothetical protein HZB51_18885 [Chloroflexi bacterium]|nr:hypothetical protein [Chloroflexota bacterium]
MRQQANHTRYQLGQPAGHYESFFLRANHPSRPLAFWIRYTVFSPDRYPENAIGELWAVCFDGETQQHVAVKQEVPLVACVFKTQEFYVQVGDASLQPGRLNGAAHSEGHSISWNLTFGGDAEPLFLLPLNLYDASLPKAKSLVSLPMAVFNGILTVDGKEIDVANWVGSQNHNWGAKHTDLYAWGQVAGFDNDPDSFLEVATARLKLGPLWTPPMTPMVLRHRGEEIALNNLMQSFRARGAFRYFEWAFRSETHDVRLEGKIVAPREAFVGLNYSNPPGGIKHCLNTKIATCELQLIRKHNGKTSQPEILSTQHRAAFEILTDDRGHGVEIRV